MLTDCLTIIGEKDEDRDLFMKLFREHNHRLERVALSTLKTPELSADAVGETWVKVAEKFNVIRGIKEDERILYLISMTRNVALDMLRKEQHTVAFNEDWEEYYPGRDDSGQIGFNRLKELIRSMPTDYREILELKFVLEYKNSEIAKAMGINASTVSTRVARGREMLIRKLESEGITL